MTRRKGRFDYATSSAPAAPVEQVPQAIPVQPEVLAVPEVTASPALPATPATDALRNPEAYALPPQQRGRRAADADTTLPRRTDVPREQLNVRIRPELKRAAAGVAGLQGMTLGDVVEAALIAYLKAAGRQDV